MSVVLMRTLTRKSIIGFGAYTDLTVQNLIDTFRHKELYSIYYNFRNIDFCQDLKDELCIYGEREIDKKKPNPDRFIKDAYKLIAMCMKEMIDKKDATQAKKEIQMIGKLKKTNKEHQKVKEYKLQVSVFGKAAQRNKNQW